MAKKRLLVIPHFPLVPNLLLRGEALAQGLAAHFDVHLLSWYYDPRDDRPRLARSVARLEGLFKPRRVFARDRVTVIETPLAYVRHPRLRFLARFNTAIVNRILSVYDIDAVVNELAVVNSRDLARPHVIDIVDLPTPFELRRWHEQAARASGIITITDGLRDQLARHGLQAEVVGNGADVSRFRGASGDRAREAHGLGGKFVIGYIGNHAEWSGLDFLLDVYKEVKRRMADAALVIVGPGTEVPAAKARCRRENIEGVTFTGPIDLATVPQYFKAIDLAVLPFELDAHATLSFPIKIVEYSAAQKIVVASPLKVLAGLGLPNINLVSRDVAAWVAAILELRRATWQPEWDRQVDRYDWQALADRLALLIRAWL
jgi:glycosyltransferase involved in cell wall biosynthesis